MKIYYDAEIDALYIEFRPLAAGTAENRDLTEDITANYAPDGKIAGLEILDASSVLEADLGKIIFEFSPVPTLVKA
ncbi:DUF2283 domain-containing protein [Pseudanabaena sp. 'Roaring Creek']|jgi:uncharacterized protein YuzE|uniref:DUF2283 domain-containing protein n=1 Tax=Pseudanabaena sp. 'Roaring Creek' TaxID=1681830 RepID=UPI0006D7E9E7|nr:DUF2283 domain-containing protein [Pseudanabaena sp. 'Roaring Creek']